MIYALRVGIAQWTTDWANFVPTEERREEYRRNMQEIRWLVQHNALLTKRLHEEELKQEEQHERRNRTEKLARKA